MIINYKYFEVNRGAGAQCVCACVCVCSAGTQCLQKFFALVAPTFFRVESEENSVLTFDSLLILRQVRDIRYNVKMKKELAKSLVYNVLLFDIVCKLLFLSFSVYSIFPFIIDIQLVLPANLNISFSRFTAI